MADRSEKAVITTMCLVRDGNRILVQDRKKSWCGLALPGGHVEKGEPVTVGVIREVLEETGLTIEKPKLCGIKHFQTDKDERYLVFLYTADRFSGELISSEEGEVFWLSEENFSQHTWASDMLPLLEIFLDPEKQEFFYHRGSEDWNIEIF